MKHHAMVQHVLERYNPRRVEKKYLTISKGFFSRRLLYRSRTCWTVAWCAYASYCSIKARCTQYNKLLFTVNALHIKIYQKNGVPWQKLKGKESYEDQTDAMAVFYELKVLEPGSIITPFANKISMTVKNRIIKKKSFNLYLFKYCSN